jgi:outer membrane receptor protein involved in Fe transport
VVNLVTHRSLFEAHPVMDFTFTARGSEPGDGNAQQIRGRVRASSWGAEFAGGVGSLDALHTPDGPLPNSSYSEDNYSMRGALAMGPAVLDYEHSHQAAHDIGLPVFNGELGFSTSSGFTGVYPLQSRDADRLELSAPTAGARPEMRLLAVVQTQRSYFTETSTDSTYSGGRLVRTSTNAANDRVTSWSRGIQPIVHFEGLAGLRLTGEYRDETAGGPRITEKTPTLYPLFGPPIVQSTTTTVGESVPDALQHAWSASAFTRPVISGVRFETGARYDWVSSHADSSASSTNARLDETDSHWSGEAGISGPVGGVEPYAHVASGFRVPNLDERYYNNEIHGGMRLYGNPDLRPEQSLSYEIGVRATDRIGDWLPEARVSAYRSEVEDLISFRYVTTVNLVPRFQYYNLRNARIEGIEFQSRVRLGWGVGVALNAGFPRGTDTETGKRILDVGTGRVTMDVTVPAARLLPMGQFAARMRWSEAVPSQTVQDQLLARPSFFVTSVEASSVVGGVRTVFAVKNLFNTYYLEPLSFIPEAGRTYALSMRWDFNVPIGIGRKAS